MRGQPGSYVFSAITAPITFTTQAAQDLPPAQPKGLEITLETADKIVVAAMKTDCARVVTSTAGSTTTKNIRTITCVK